MLRFKLSILFCLITTYTQASEESLWKYSLFQCNIDNDSIEPLKNSPKITSYDHGRCLHLQGVVIGESGEWILWINGGKLLKSKQKPNLYVERLSQNRVTFKWLLEDKTHTFTLHLHESFHASTQTVIKGGCS